jgi:ATP10 protein
MKRIKKLSTFILLTSGAVASLALASCRHQSLGLRTEMASMETSSTLYFPTITSENLNKDPVTLPDDLSGNPALVLVAYKQKQQFNVNTWLDQLGRIEEAIPGVRVIETPTISSKRWGWMAGFIDGGMRSGIPDIEARARTITLYTDIKAFNQALGIEDVETIYAVLLDEKGQVLTIEPGDFSLEKMDRLIQYMN